MTILPFYASNAVPFLEGAEAVRLLSLVGKQISLECRRYLEHFLKHTRSISVDPSRVKSASGIGRFKHLERIDFTFGSSTVSSLHAAAELMDCGAVCVGFVVSELGASFQAKTFVNVALKLLPPRVSTLELVVDASFDLETSEYIIRCIPRSIARLSVKHTHPPRSPLESAGADWFFVVEPDMRPSAFDLWYENDRMDNSTWISLWLRSMPRGCNVTAVISIRRLLRRHLIEFLVDVHYAVELADIRISLLRIVVGKRSEYTLLRQWYDFYNDVRECEMLSMLPMIEFSSSAHQCS